MPSIDHGLPRMLVVVDTEEEFDWNAPFSRSAVGVGHVRHQARGQQIFERFGLRPTYVVDYPVAAQEQGYRPLAEWRDAGRCDIGAHLHPWVNPPFVEEVSARNSYPGNLPPALEREKLTQLTDTIEANFRYRPRVYRAGRYGIGAATGAILEQLGYGIDTSVVPRTDFTPEAGPDFRALGGNPFWFGPTGKVLEIPLTVGWSGALGRHYKRLQPALHSGLGHRLRVGGIMARLRLLERIRLSPEGITLAELKRLTRTLIGRGQRLFGFTYHSPSLAPGNTPYVRSESDLQRFLGVIEGYCEYFFGACGGVPSSLQEVHGLLAADRAAQVGSAEPDAQSKAPMVV